MAIMNGIARVVAVHCFAATLAGCALDQGPTEPELGKASEALDIKVPLPVIFNYTFPAGCTRGTVTARNSDGTVVVSGLWFGDKPVSSLQVAGKTVALAADKSWSVRVPANVGLNSFRVVSKDTAGRVFNNVCAVFAGEKVVGTGDTLGHGVVLGLAKGDIDDGTPSDPIGSIGDAARRVLASEALKNTITKELDAIADRDLFGNWSYDFREFKFGAAKLSLTAKTGALHVALRLTDVRANGKLIRDGWLIDSESNMDAKIDALSVEFDLAMSVDAAGKAKVTGVIEDGDVDIDNLHVEGDGLIGEAIDDVVTFFASGAFKGAIRRGVTSAVRNDLAGQLEDLIDGIDEGGLARTTLSVPNLTGGGTTPLAFSGKLSSLQLSNAGLFASFATSITSSAKADLFGQTLGSASAPALSTRSFAGISLGAVNQALLALYRTGYFTVADPNATFRLGLPSGSTMSLSLLNAPVVTGPASGNAVRIGIAATASVGLPGVPVVRGDFYLSLRAPVTVLGKDGVGFGDVAVESVEFDPGNVSGAAALVVPTIVATAVRSAVSGSVNRTLDNLQLFRIPSFRVPASLADAKLPAGSRLGLASPSVQASASHVSLVGDLGQL